MANITAANLTSDISLTDATSYATASISPSANKLVLAVFISLKSTGQDIPTASGNGLTWVNIESILVTTDVRLTVFRAMGASPSSGSITFNVTNTHLQAGWIVDEFTNMDTGGANGADAVVQSDQANGNSTTALVTLAAFGNVNNATYGAMGKSTATTWTVGSGFSLLAVEATPNALQTEWRNDNDTTVDGTLSSGGPWGIIGVEIKNADQSSGKVSGAHGKMGFMF